jgi:Ran GTPase-activating protein (RanGAP) involved in mRNA processing and transport
MCGL